MQVLLANGGRCGTLLVRSRHAWLHTRLLFDIHLPQLEKSQVTVAQREHWKDSKFSQLVHVA